METVVGIDLGGTFVRAGSFDPAGRLLVSHERPIEAVQGARVGLGRITHLIENCLKETGGELIGIGMGATGPIDRQQGLIQNPYTLPGWGNVPVIDPLCQHFGVPVVLENDADVAALGEYWAGAGQGVQRLYAVTVGTGIGTAFILNGHIYRGLDGLHPEGGHHIVDPSGPPCYCGAHGCWEFLASGPAIVQRAREGFVKHPDSLLVGLAGGDAEQTDARMVTDAARRGDPFAIEVIDRAAVYLALGMVNVIAMYLPEIVVLSGGVMKSADLFLPTIKETLQRHGVMQPVSRVKIALASLGYLSGMYGAAYAILQKLRETQ